jgi:hypothetical protein
MKIHPLFILLFILTLSACNLPGNTPPPTSIPAPSLAAPSAPPTLPPAVLPSPTSPSGRVILVTPPETSAALAQEAQKALSELAQPAGLTLSTVQTLQPNEVTPEVKLVFYTSIPPNLPQVVAAAPNVQFAAVSPVDITPVPNFSVIRLQPEKRTFIAGLVSILSANDWRTLGLLPIQEPAASTLEDAFRNGAQYFCGICNSFLAPMTHFPLIRHTDVDNYQSVVTEANKSFIYVIYVAPEISSPEMLNALAAQKFILVGSDTPPDGARPRWAATVREDVITPMRSLWPDMLAQKGGKVVYASISIEDTNSAFFSEGKKDLVKNVIQEMDKGLISPLTPAMQ